MNHIRSAAEFTRQNELSKPHTEMPNTVEQLRMGLLLQVSMMQKHVELLDSLISAARAEGKAEGAEQVKKTIRKWIGEPDPANFGERIHVSIFGEFQLVNLTDLLSVLAPTKEAAG